MSKYATIDELKKVDSFAQAVSGKADKNTAEIKNIYDLISQVQRSQGKAQPTKSSSSDDLAPLTARVEKLENGLSALRKIVDELRAYMNKALEGLKVGQPSPTPTKSMDNDELERLANELEKLKHLLDDRFNQLLQLIDKKADKTDLDNLERRFVERLNDLIKNFIDRFADKKDVYKRLTTIEKQIKTLFDMLMNQESHRANEEDAMFTKKPLGGVSCASCEKNITNLSG